MSQFTPIQGRAGRVIMDVGAGPTEIVEATAIEYNVAIEQVVIQQGLGYWKSYVDGEIEGTGQMTIEKSNSRFELLLLPFLTMRVEDMRALRDQGRALRERFTLEVSLDDPNVLGGYESVTLRECLIWDLPGGYERGAKVQRRYRFTFEGIVPGGPLIPVSGADRTPVTI